jgi:hypothetical protein
MPISMRTSAEAAGGGNQVRLVRVPLFTQVDDGLERLARIQAATVRLKQMSVGARTLAELSDALPGALLGLGARAIGRLPTLPGRSLGVNTVVTNVPGPREPLYFGQSEVVRTYGTGPVFNGVGVIHIILSYHRDLIFSFTACREMLPDPEFHAACIEESLDEMRVAV